MPNFVISDNQRQELSNSLEYLLQEAKNKGASAAEATISQEVGFQVTSRMREVESIEYNSDSGVSLTFYIGDKQGNVSTTDLAKESLAECVAKAASIAKLAGDDAYAGLADSKLMAKEFPDLHLCNPWNIDPTNASKLAIECENVALAADSLITNSEGASISTFESMSIYGNSHGFSGIKHRTNHQIYCSLIAAQDGQMQRDYEYTVVRDPTDLMDLTTLAKSAATKAVKRLNPRPIKTCQVPVIFSAQVSRRLLSHFVSAVSGGSLYRQASFLLDMVGKQVFNSAISLREDPMLLKGMGSAVFDSEGVATKPRVLVQDGILQGYILDSYSGRKLNLNTTANAGGAHNLIIKTETEDFTSLLRGMGRGLLVTHLMGMGENIVTGDYSQGAAGFWVENGEIQHAVDEVTVAANLRDILLNIVAMGDDIDRRGIIHTGSLMIEQMTVAGK